MEEQTKSTWIIDNNHSEIQFKVKHLAVSDVTGMFKKFSGTVQTNNIDFKNAEVNVVIETGSLDTNQQTATVIFDLICF